jgi:methionyl-tRNA synthetase
MKKTVYITTPIYYASGNPHIGHAFSTIYGDVLAKYKRLVGYDALFQTGMDEHGQKIEDIAKEKKVDVKTFVDDITNKFKDLWDKLDIQCDSFVRTSEPRHIDVVQKVFQDFQDKGYVYLGS